MTSTVPVNEVITKSNAEPQSRASTKSNIDTSTEATFTLFLELPLELRLKIWNAALPGRRIIQVKFMSDGRKNQHWFCAKSPVIFHVSYESRKEALREYPRAFQNPNALNGCYFNYTLDTLLLSENHSQNQLKAFISNKSVAVDIAKVETLALNRWHLTDPISDVSVMEYVLKFRGIKQLQLIVGTKTYDQAPLGSSRSVDLIDYEPEFWRNQMRKKLISNWTADLKNPEKFKTIKFKDTLQIPEILFKLAAFRFARGEHQWLQ